MCRAGQLSRGRLPSRVLKGACRVLLAFAVASAGAVAMATMEGPPPSLLAAGVARAPCGGRVLAVPATVTGRYLAGSSVLRVAGGYYTGRGAPAPASAAENACARRAARADRRWLFSGLIPGGSRAQRSMAARALLDLRLLTRSDGGVAAAWHRGWDYAWPRDSSWVCAALADAGHPRESLRILRFLQRSQAAGGGWAARYRLDGSGAVRDSRPSELDSAGWVPWAVWSWFTAQRPGSPAARRDLAELWPMVAAAANAAAASLTSDGLPRAAMDYWEHSVQVTLGTAAPLLTGLRAAADLARMTGDRVSRRRWSAAAGRLSGAIASGFGRYGYHRRPHERHGADAAVTFLGPPFAAGGPAIRRAVDAAWRRLRLPSGGVLPGAGWPGNPSVAWTAETAFFALYDASSGEHARAARILAWLQAHRTRIGALPEQVSADGSPVSVAPLAWTDAAVLLALLAQDRHLPAAPPPG